jgi:hypothetical protein
MDLSRVAPRSKRLAQYFSRIETVEQAEAAVREVAHFLYGLAALDFLVALFDAFFVSSGLAWIAVDAAFVVTMALVLRATKSRCVALLIAAYAILSGTMTVLNVFGITHMGGTNLVLAAMIAGIACRAVYVTSVYHRLRHSRTQLKNVVILSVVATGLSAVVFFIVVCGWIAFGGLHRPETDNSMLGMATLVAIVGVWLLVFNRLLPFTRRLRVVRSDVAAA